MVVYLHVVIVFELVVFGVYNFTFLVSNLVVDSVNLVQIRLFRFLFRQF